MANSLALRIFQKKTIWVGEFWSADVPLSSENWKFWNPTACWNMTKSGNRKCINDPEMQFPNDIIFVTRVSIEFGWTFGDVVFYLAGPENRDSTRGFCYTRVKQVCFFNTRVRQNAANFPMIWGVSRLVNLYDSALCMIYIYIYCTYLSTPKDKYSNWQEAFLKGIPSGIYKYKHVLRSANMAA